jgi:protein-S-isoprenylcysteine O-methyltransferase Ste14
VTGATLVRLASWLLPIALAYILVAIRRPSPRVLTGVLLSVAWNLSAVLAVNIVAGQLGWWSFRGDMPSFMGVPVEPWIGWTVLWGAVLPLAAWDRPVIVTVLACVWFDLIAMPAMGMTIEPIVVLHGSWLVGEAVAIGVALIPSFLLARWTALGSNLYARATLQVVCAGALMLWLVPSIALESSGGWERIMSLPPWQLSLALQVLSVPCVLGVRAVIEFVRQGRGTPLPYDPPHALVTGGPYSYVTNPMQLSIVLYFLLGAIAFQNALLGLATAMALMYGAGLAEWHEESQLAERFGSEWTRYRAEVRAWLPRWRPAVTTDSTLLIAFSCTGCSSIGRWFLVRHPVGLEIAPAEDSTDESIRRVTYVQPVGPPATGVAAIARALEHIHLGWALVGWFLALPGVVHLVQVMADAFGPNPHEVKGLSYDPRACSIGR